jgi:hypothetical protein
MPVEHPASDISVSPAGEIIATDVQAALEDLDERTRIDRFLADREVGFDVREEFLGGGSYPAGGWLGQNSWSIPTTITGTPPPTIQAVTGAFGVVAVGTTNNGQWSNINLGAATALAGAPVLHLKIRARLSNLNNVGHQSSYFVGLHSDLAGAEPLHGMYFRYSQAGGASWCAVVANGGVRSGPSTGVAPVAGTFQWLEILCDGAGVVRFYIDGALVQTISTNLPAGANRYGPSITAVRTFGSNGLRTVQVDTFDLRVEGAR